MKRQKVAILSIVLFMSTISLIPVESIRRVLPTIYINLTASVPRGVYRLSPASQVNTGDLVVFWPPEHLQNDPTLTRWLRNYPMIKLVGAAANQKICRSDNFLKIFPKENDLRLEVHDRSRVSWKLKGYCTQLRERTFLPIGTHPKSFDGRYFGPVNTSSVIGKAVPIVTF